MERVLKVRRGMVFWYNTFDGQDKNRPLVHYRGKTIQSRLIAGDRPHLVVSIDEENAKTSTCNIISMTHKVFIRESPNVVYFETGTGTARESSTVLCNMIHTVDQDLLTEYIYCLPESLMERVTAAMAYQLGIPTEIKFSDSDMQSTFAEIEGLVRRAILEKVEAYHSKFSEGVSQSEVTNAAHRLKDCLETSLFDSAVRDLDNTTVSYENREVALESVIKTPVTCTSQVEKFNKRWGMRKDTVATKTTVAVAKKETEPSKTVAVTKAKRGNGTKIHHKIHRRWTIELMKQFIQDVNTLSRSEVASKWEYTEDSVHKTFAYCKKVLTEKGISF